MPFNMTQASSIALACSLAALSLTSCTQTSSEGEDMNMAAVHVVQEPPATIYNSASGLLPPIEAENAQFEVENGVITAFFSAANNQSAVSIVPNTPLDLTGYKNSNLAVDMANDSDKSVTVHLGFVDDDGTFQNSFAVVPPKSAGTYYVILDDAYVGVDMGMRDIAPRGPKDEEMMILRWSGGPEGFDRSAIKKLRFFTRGIIEDKSVRIDNIRIRPNPNLSQDYMVEMVDRFGQNRKRDFPIKVSSEAELKTAADNELAELEASSIFDDRSRFGGWKDGPMLEATGYFRVEKVDDKWWMVDPDGYLFFSHGPANVRMSNLFTLTGVDFADDSIRTVDPNEVTPEDSIGTVHVPDEIRATRFVTNERRHEMFTWLPKYDDELADHYSYRRSTHLGPIKSGETYSFYRANLERRYGETRPSSYLDTWRDVTLDRMNSWGFTSFGNWVDPAFYPNEQVPYFANGWIIGDFQTLKPDMNVWGSIPDFYDPLFAERAEATISTIADEIKGSPWCVGIFIDNEKSWGVPSAPPEARYSVVLDALSKSSSESFAKNAFSQQLQDKYGSIDALNTAWEINLSSWDSFNQGYQPTKFNDTLVTDLSMLYSNFSEEYFRIVDSTLDRYLPNHLYMGARMASWGMPKETVEAAIKHSDVMSFNIYEEGLRDGGWDFFEEIDKPVIIGEFHIGATSDTGLNHPGLIYASDQADRARMYKDYMASVTSNPYLVGAHWFQYVDSPLTGRAFDGENYNVGFVNVTDQPYPEMVAATGEIMRNLYPDRFGK